MRIVRSVSDRRNVAELFVKVYMAIAAFLLLLALLRYMAMTLHWPLMFDTQEMLYINFLIHHGMVPYRDLSDINMPGVYLFHAVAAAVFGPSDVDWRICEFTLGFVLIASMTFIARPYGRLAGLLAGVLFLLLHAAHGPGNAMQRDEIMTVFAVAAYAALFESLRRRRPWLAGLFGFLIGFAVTIKPMILLLAIFALAAALYGAWRQGLKLAPYLLFGLGGIAAALSTSLIYLWYYHAGAAFLFIMRTALPAYLGSNSPTWHAMFANLMQWPLQDFIVLAVAAEVARRISSGKSEAAVPASERWETLALLGGVFGGLASYLLQHKGFVYHVYPFYAFLLLCVGIAVVRALKTPGLGRWLAVACLSYCLFRSVPMYLHRISVVPSHDPFSHALEADLDRLQPARLDHRVQCMDVVLGCMTALYHDGLVQYSGFTGDLLFFVPVETPLVKYYRDIFLNDVETVPPAVFIVSNQRWGAGESFRKLDAWPSFKAYLEQNYELTTQRQFPSDTGSSFSPLGSDTTSMAYRIYIRKGSPLLKDAPRTP